VTPVGGISFATVVGLPLPQEGRSTQLTIRAIKAKPEKNFPIKSFAKE
jgi:hypothetical protein